MASELRGVASAFCQTEDFADVAPTEVEAALERAKASFRFALATGGVGTPLVRSGDAFTHLLLVQAGIVIPWQQPHSELKPPFLIGVHELLMNSERWVATYSAVANSTILEVPREVLQSVLQDLPEVRERMLNLILHRISRFYWTSLSTTGTPRARVAAALVSRLALHSDDFGRDREVSVRQVDLVRLTALSRTAVAKAIRELEAVGLVQDSHPSSARYFSGTVLIPSVDDLKEVAFSDVRSVIEDRFESQHEN